MQRIKPFLAILLLLTLLGCNNGNQATQSNHSQEFRLALLTWIGYGPFWLAQAKGFFKEEGVKVKIVKIDNDAARLAAVMGRKVDAVVGPTIDACAKMAAEGVPVKVVLKIDNSCGGDGIVARQEIKNLKDLKGKTVAYPKGQPSHFFLLSILKKVGLTAQDIKSKHMEAERAGQAFIAGSVDAAVTWEPFLSTAARQGHILTTSRQCPNLIVDVLLVHEEVYKTRAEDIRKIQRAWFKAIDYWRQFPDEANKIMGKASMSLSPKEFAQLVKGIKYCDYADNCKFFGLQGQGSNIFKQKFAEASRIYQSVGLIRTPASADQVYGGDLLKNLYAQGKSK